jgi:hypothetical protein
MNILRVTISLLVIIALLPACDNGDGGGGKSKSQMVDELAARNLASRAANMDLNARKMEAAELYKEIAAKYPHTEIFAKLKDELFQKGISIEDPNFSKTSQSMFKAQRRVISFKQRKGFYPSLSAIKIPPDAWGSTLVLKISKDENDTYEFVIVSKGPDYALDTDDDLFLLYQGKRGHVSADNTGNTAGEKPQTIRAGRVELSTLKMRNRPARSSRAPEGALSKGKKQSSKAALGGTTADEKSNSRTGDNEVVISLEDL